MARCWTRSNLLKMWGWKMETLCDILEAENLICNHQLLRWFLHVVLCVSSWWFSCKCDKLGSFANSQTWMWLISGFICFSVGGATCFSVRRGYFLHFKIKRLLPLGTILLLTCNSWGHYLCSSATASHCCNRRSFCFVVQWRRPGGYLG